MLAAAGQTFILIFGENGLLLYTASSLSLSGGVGVCVSLFLSLLPSRHTVELTKSLLPSLNVLILREKGMGSSLCCNPMAGAPHFLSCGKTPERDCASQQEGGESSGFCDTAGTGGARS